MIIFTVYNKPSPATRKAVYYAALFDIEYLRNDTRYGYCMVTWSSVLCSRWTNDLEFAVG